MIQKVRLSHLPTWLLLIGYPLYWLEMLMKPGPHTSITAAILFLLCALWHIKHLSYPLPLKISELPWSARLWGLIGFCILGISFLAALLPLHLTQEGDALNYHYSLVRQHLIAGSFKHLPWSSADLWVLPGQYALAPYWFCTNVPNKFPQFIFLLGLLGIAWSLVYRQAANRVASVAAVAAILGSHGFSIQFGSAMLDIPMAYLTIATLDSFLSANWFLAVTEFSFLVWFKPFTPLQVGVILMGLGIFELFRKSLQWQWTLGFWDPLIIPAAVPWKHLLLTFSILSLFIAGPFIGKSLYYAGTPLYPFKPFMVGGQLSRDLGHQEAVIEASIKLLTARTSYGEGHDFKHFLTHFWMVAVPSTAVNNAFDYPVGLPYLLCLFPFIVFFVQAARHHQLSILACLVVLFWGTWWIGSQQSRWLYVPLVLMFVTTLSNEEILKSVPLKMGLTISCLLVCLSLYRAHVRDFRLFPQMPIRPSDRNLLEATRGWPGPGLYIAHNKLIAYSEAPTDVVADPEEYVLRRTH